MRGGSDDPAARFARGAVPTPSACPRRPTVPTSVAEELRHNPFLRVHEAAVQEAMGTVGDSLATLTRLRQAKDAF